MSNVTKLITALVTLVVLAIVGLTLFVRFYFTDERVRTLVLPKAEAALGRTVQLGTIDVGLFSGITIDGLDIKEADGKEDFVAADHLVLRYSLLPLLQKKLFIHELRIERPRVYIRRDATGRFNYETLAFLTKSPEKSPESTVAGKGKEALPIGLSVQEVTITDGRIRLTDDKKELPDVDAGFSLGLGLDISHDLRHLRYQGTLDLDAAIRKDTLQPRITGTVQFDEKTASLDIECAIDGQQLTLNGKATDYRTAPALQLDLTSKELDVDRLLGLLAGDGKKAQPKTPPAGSVEPTGPIAAKLPPGLTAQGKLAVEKAIYKGMTINALLLRYRLADGVLHLSELGAVALGGSLTGAVDIDLTKTNPGFSGKLSLASVQADQLQSHLARSARRLLTGTVEAALSFAGTGTDVATIKKTLTADGTFAIKNGRFVETPLTTSIAALIGAPELRTFTFNDFSGTFQIVEGGRVRLDSNIDSPAVKVEAAGEIGLDGTLDLPLAITLPRSMTGRLGGAASRFLTDAAGNTTVNLKLAGTVSRPRPTLDTTTVRKQVEKNLKQKLFEKIGIPSGGTTGQGAAGAANPAKSLLRGLFGR